jgi:hypothetical protein
MRLEAVRKWWLGLNVLEWTAVVVWSVILLAICIRVSVSPRAHSVFPIFSIAGRHWLTGKELYYPHFFDPDLDNFRYSPLAAALFAPWSALSDRLGGVLWRLVSGGLYIGALTWWARTVLPVCLNRSQQALLFLLTAPLSIGCLNNGQSNVILIALLLGSTAAVQAGRWNLAAGCVAMATLFKIYPGVLGLLLALVFPRKFALRFLLALALGLALPFLLQRPDYVAQQYVHWWDLLLSDHRQDRPVSNLVSRDLWLAIRLVPIPMSSTGYRVIQLSLGGGVALLSMAGRLTNWPQRVLLTMIFSSAGCWMVLCGPATESCTYILLAPILAWAVLDAALDRRPLWSRLIPWCSLVLFVFSQTISWFPENVRMLFLGILPLAGIVLWSGLVEANVRKLFQNSGASQEPMEFPLARAA